MVKTYGSIKSSWVNTYYVPQTEDMNTTPYTLYRTRFVETALAVDVGDPQVIEQQIINKLLTEYPKVDQKIVYMRVACETLYYPALPQELTVDITVYHVDKGIAVISALLAIVLAIVGGFIFYGSLPLIYKAANITPQEVQEYLNVVTDPINDVLGGSGLIVLALLVVMILKD